MSNRIASISVMLILGTYRLHSSSIVGPTSLLGTQGESEEIEPMTVHDHSTRASVEAPAVPPTWTPPVAAEPEPAPAAKRDPKVAIAGALVAVAVASAGVTAGIMAATDGSNSSTGTAAAGGPGGGGQFGGRGGAGAANSLHGTAVVSDGNGGYTTQLTQTGTVSAVSAGSITVKSADGYSKTYVVGSSTTVDNGNDQIADVATGHTVRIVATDAAATTITDTTIDTTQQGGGFPQGGPQGGVPGN
jgi:hypothetical protein